MVHVSTNPGSRSAQCPYPWGISHVHRFTTISRRFLGVTLPEGLGLVLLPLKNRLTNMCLPVRRTGEPFSRTSSEGVRKASARSEAAENASHESLPTPQGTKNEDQHGEGGRTNRASGTRRKRWAGESAPETKLLLCWNYTGWKA